MFPLGSVLFPGAVLPLHVFEPRYQALVRDCVAGEPEFGVALIERGFEVGGGDQRSGIGTVARIIELAELSEGRYAIVAVGTRRIRITRWLDDAPYPRADVEDWPDDVPLSSATDDRYAEVVARLRRVLAMCAELGLPAAAATVELADDVRLGAYHAAALAPLGSHDRQRLLLAPGPDERLALLDELLAEQAEVLALQLGPAGSA